MSERNPTDLSAQRAETARLEALQQQVHKRDQEDIKWLMSSQGGRRIMWGLLGRAGVFRSSFTGNSTTFFNEGQRNLGLIYLNLINEFCPDQYVTMAREAAEQGKAKNAE